MDIFDIIGPVMVGPSSSHTAGAVRIGYISQRLMGEQISKAEILLYGSFLDTGKGHGTNKAIVAGLLGMKPDDMRIPESLDIAKKRGIEITFGKSSLKEAHPNSAQLILTSVTGKKLEVVGESLGGSRINIAPRNPKRWNRMAETCRRYRKGNISWHRIADIADMI